MEVLLDLLYQEGAAGATVIRALGGFGASRKITLARLADVVPNLRIILEWIDSAEAVERPLPGSALPSNVARSPTTSGSCLPAARATIAWSACAQDVGQALEANLAARGFD